MIGFDTRFYPNNGTVMQQTLLLTPDNCKIKPLFDIQSILSQG